MESTWSRSVRAVPGAVGLALCSVMLTLASCSSNEERPEASGTTTSPVIALDPPANVVAGTPSNRSATCPGHELPDQCGSWAGVALHATRTKTHGHGWHHHECRHHGHSHHSDVTTADDEHCLCEPIEFVIPAELPVTAGQAGGDWDKAELSFRTKSGKLVECEYRGNFEKRRGGHPESGGDKYEFQRCTRGFKVGQTTQSDWFQLELGDGHGSESNVQVDLRLGEPDVVDGVVQEQIFYADDSRVLGAALHVPRGSAPDFASFALDVVPQVAPGTVIQNGGQPATSVGYAVDVHSETMDSFVFTPVPGACPRIELPYDPARLEALLGPGHEPELNASHLSSVAAIGGGGTVLEPMGPVTVDLANHTVSFCVEHLSIYLTNTATNSASIELAQLREGGTVIATLVDTATPSNEATVLPTLVAGKSYDLTLRYKNNGTATWSTSYKLVAVGKPPVAELAAGDPSWVSWNTAAPSSMPTRTCSMETNCDNGVLGLESNGSAADGSVAQNETGTFTMKLTAPTNAAPMNFCMRSGSSAYFGECFSWDPHLYLAGGGNLPPQVCVPSTEICNGKDDDCDNQFDEGLPTPYRDADGDGFGDANQPIPGCLVPPGYVTNAGDCNDSNAGINPNQSAAAQCNQDLDCDGSGIENVACSPGTSSSCVECPALATGRFNVSSSQFCGGSCDYGSCTTGPQQVFDIIPDMFTAGGVPGWPDCPLTATRNGNDTEWYTDYTTVGTQDDECGFFTSSWLYLTPGNYTLTFGNYDTAVPVTPRTTVGVRNGDAEHGALWLATTNVWNTNAGWETKQLNFTLTSCQLLRVMAIAMVTYYDFPDDKFGGNLYRGGNALGQFRLVRN